MDAVGWGDACADAAWKDPSSNLCLLLLALPHAQMHEKGCSKKPYVQE